MTMTENQTTVQPAAVVDVEAIYGQDLLDQVATLTAELTERRDDLRALLARATTVAKAVSVAEARLDSDGLGIDVADGFWAVVNDVAGVRALSVLAGECGLYYAIFETDGPDDAEESVA